MLRCVCLRSNTNLPAFNRVKTPKQELNFELFTLRLTLALEDPDT